MSKCVEIGERELKVIFPRKIFLAQGLQSIVACQKFVAIFVAIIYCCYILIYYCCYTNSIGIVFTGNIFCVLMLRLIVYGVKALTARNLLQGSYIFI